MSNEAKKTTKKVQTKHLYLIVTAALCAALIAVMTAFVKFNTGINDGYLHFGDSMVYLAACILPLPYAMVAAAIGGALADILAGAAVWAPFTAVIKALNTVPFALMYTLRLQNSRTGYLTRQPQVCPCFRDL